MMEFEQRVRFSIKTAKHPLFPSGVPLAPEFTSMFSAAKASAAKALSPYLTQKELDAATELSIFMLVTLPVLTVALRSADANSRRPMPPRGQPLAPPPPRIVKFPNSPAKVDREAVAEARAANEARKAAAAAAGASEAAAAATVVPGTNSGAVTFGSSTVVPEEVKTVVAAEILSEVGLAGEVVVAAAADPGKLEAELKRLRSELAATTKLAEKVKALEQANARLSGRIAELNRQPSAEEVLRRAEVQEAR